MSMKKFFTRPKFTNLLSVMLYNSNGGCMTTVIYVDVLVAVNIFITYVLLVCTRVILKRDTSKWGIAVSSFIGGASSLVIFFEEIPLVFSVFYKLLLALVISFFTFLPKDKKLLFKASFSFFLVSFIFGGVMYFVEITFNLNNVLYINGTVYFDVSIFFLVSMTLICYGLLLLGDYVLKRRASSNTLYEVTVSFKGKKVSVNALYDTGNHLSDALTGKTVNVIELEKAAVLFSAEEYEFFENPSLALTVPETLCKDFKIIPCNALTGEGVMKGFVPQRVVVKNKSINFEIENTVFAVCNKSLSQNEYNCILNSEIFERGRIITDEKFERKI